MTSTPRRPCGTSASSLPPPSPSSRQHPLAQMVFDLHTRVSLHISFISVCLAGWLAVLVCVSVCRCACRAGSSPSSATWPLVTNIASYVAETLQVGARAQHSLPLAKRATKTFSRHADGECSLTRAVCVVLQMLGVDCSDWLQRGSSSLKGHAASAKGQGQAADGPPASE
eukprot:2929186-Rhodomonas_salina.1